MNNIDMPDFEEWTKNILSDSSNKSNTQYNYKIIVEAALRQAFEHGYTYRLQQEKWWMYIDSDEIEQKRLIELILQEDKEILDQINDD